MESYRERRIQDLQSKIAQLVGYHDGVKKTLHPVRDLVAHIARFLCRFAEDGEEFFFGRKTLQCVTLYSMGWGKKYLFLYDTWADKKPPDVPALNDEGFGDNNPDAPRIKSPTEADLQWVAENIARIVRRFALEVDRKGWAWQEFVRDFYEHFLIANPVLRRIHERATAHAMQRWIESPDLANFVAQYWERVYKYDFQEFPDAITSGRIYHKDGTYAAVVSYCEGTPQMMPLRSVSIAFGITYHEMENLMYGAIF
jgi:hypothetical protein